MNKNLKAVIFSLLIAVLVVPVALAIPIKSVGAQSPNPPSPNPGAQGQAGGKASVRPAQQPLIHLRENL